MGYAIYEVGDRWGGYGVPAVCEYPTCDEKIDRGMAFACGGEPFSEYGCDRYFCGKHREMIGFNTDGDGGICEHEEDCDCEYKEVCERCANGGEPFPYKKETKEWVKHLLNDKTWEQWRKKNPQKVQEFLTTPPLTK